MKYRKMGERIPWKVSALGFGCMRLPKKKFLFWKRLDEEEAIRIIRMGIDMGINYVDTAWGYHGGKSEVTVGKALKDGYREKVHLVTKLPIWKVKEPEDFDKYLAKQLDRLQTDHLDIYLFHALNKDRFENKVKKFNLIEKMEKARKEGLIKHIGFSFHDNFKVFRQIVDFYEWDSCLVQHNYHDENIQATHEGLKYAAEKGMGVAIMEPLRGGALADPDEEVRKIIKKSTSQRSAVEWALQYLWNKTEVSVVLSGMGSEQMVKENCASADRSGPNILTEEDKNTIEKIAEVYRRKLIVPCTTCGYCLEDEGCPQGVNIPKNFSAINQFSRSQDRKKFEKEYKNLVESKDSAEECIECGVCIPKCPQEINIPEELKKVIAVFEKKRELNELRK